MVHTANRLSAGRETGSGFSLGKLPEKKGVGAQKTSVLSMTTFLQIMLAITAGGALPSATPAAAKTLEGTVQAGMTRDFLKSCQKNFWCDKGMQEVGKRVKDAKMDWRRYQEQSRKDLKSIKREAWCEHGKKLSQDIQKAWNEVIIEPRES